MSRASHWQRQARLAIDLAVDLARRDGVTDPEELIRAASLAYPFGERKHHPFKVWRNELREWFRLDALETDMRRVSETMRDPS